MKKKLSGLDKYVIFSLVCLLLFTIMVSVFQFIYPDNEFNTVLITAFFGAFGGETLLCARIKKYKLLKESKEVKDGEANEP